MDDFIISSLGWFDCSLYFTYVSCMQSNRYALRIRQRLLVVMSSETMDRPSLWRLSLNMARETLLVTVIRPI